MEIYDQNVLDHLNISPEIRSVTEAEAVHRAMIELRIRLRWEEFKGEFYPHYRSEQHYGWDIAPGLFRGQGAKLSPHEGKDMERKAITAYEPMIIDKIGKEAFRDLFNAHPNGKNWDLLFQAQHCGLHTSLIDWTMYIMTSLFFGIEESSKPDIESADGQLWAFMVPEDQMLASTNNAIGESYLNHDPFSLTRGFMTNVPVYIDNLEERICEQRISRQGGRFYASSNDTCNIPMNKQKGIIPNLFRFKIPAQYKISIRKELEALGVNHVNTYVKESPDHDKIAREVNLKIYGF